MESLSGMSSRSSISSSSCYNRSSSVLAIALVLYSVPTPKLKLDMPMISYPAYVPTVLSTPSILS